MLDVLFVAAALALAVGTLVVSRSTAVGGLLIGLAVTIGGTLVQFLATLGASWTRTSLQWVTLIALALAVVTSLALRRRDRRPPVPRPAIRVVAAVSAVLALVLTLVRILAPSDLLQTVGYLITQPVAEDNAKWLATGAVLATGDPVTTFSAVGGPLLLVMTVAASCAAALSWLTLGGVNEVAVSANTVVFSQAILICAVPFALAPLIEGRLRRWSPEGHSTRSPLPYPLGILAMAIMACASVLVTQYGHLTLQWVLLALASWTAFFAMRMRAARALLLTTFLVVMTAQVWFPLSTLAVLLLLLLALWGILQLRHRATRIVGIGTLVAVGVTAVLMSDFLRSSIAFSLSSSTASASQSFGGAARGVVAAFRTAGDSTIAIFGNPGGTEVMTTLMFVLAAVSVAVSFPMLVGGRVRPAAVTPFLPAAILTGFATGVIVLDFWSNGDGPGYASNKISFAVGIPILAVFLPIALMRIDSGARRMTAARWAAVAAIVVLLVADNLIPRAAARFKPAMFPSTSGDPSPYWALGEVRDTPAQPLVSNPMGCAFLPPGADKPTALPNGQLAYACSRLMSGLTGVGDSAGIITAWQLDEWLQNASFWDYYYPTFAQLPDEVKARTMILMNDQAEVVGIDSLASLLRRFPADPNFQR